MRVDRDLLRDAAIDRMGDVLAALGSKVRGSESRGRATCPVHHGEALSVSFANGFATCQSGCGGKTFDAIGLVAAVGGLDLRVANDFREAALRLAEILGLRLCEVDGDVRKGPSRPVRARREPPPALAPPFDVDAAWRAFPCRDEAGEKYLAGRGLLVDPLPEDVVRFNVGSAEPWLRDRQAEGYRLAFPVRRPDGSILSLSLRSVWPRSDERWQSPKDVTTKGGAVCRDLIGCLSTGEPEFERDEVVVVEGATDALAGTILFDFAAMEGRCPPRWLLGAIGVSNAPAMVRAFASVITGRTVHVALDADAAGEARVPEVMTAAREAGARDVRRMRPIGGKDLGAMVQTAKEVRS